MISVEHRMKVSWKTNIVFAMMSVLLKKSSLPTSTMHYTVLIFGVCEFDHKLITIKTSKKQNIEYTFLLFPHFFSLPKGFIKQIYDALSFSAFPLFHGSVASHGQARGGFLSLLIGRGSPISATFPFIHRALLFSPFQNNSLSSSLGKNGFAWTGLII